MKVELTAEQQAALEILKGDDNVFLTGAAGSGKSFLLRYYLGNSKTPVLASTGAAAILVGGRTFHSFFGLGIMEGGVDATIERAVSNKRVASRIRKANEIIIDEISMVSGPTLRAAEGIARRIRGGLAPWGGLRVVAVGDFAQLPPVNPYTTRKEWAFLDPVWTESQFQSVILTKIMRTQDVQFLAILNSVRQGHATQQVSEFLNRRTEIPPDGEFTRLFTHRIDVDRYNLAMLEKIDAPLHNFATDYRGREQDIDNFRKNSPIGDLIQLKIGALIMLRQNDPQNRWVNGSLAHVIEIAPDVLNVTLLNGRPVELEMVDFTLLDAEGKPVVIARNFPVSLAWAMTIHKAQGATLDRMLVDLRKVWEPGQAYVALSRARDPEALFIEGWSERAIFADPQVNHFHQSLSSEI